MIVNMQASLRSHYQHYYDSSTHDCSITNNVRPVNLDADEESTAEFDQQFLRHQQHHYGLADVTTSTTHGNLLLQLARTSTDPSILEQHDNLQQDNLRNNLGPIESDDQAPVQLQVHLPLAQARTTEDQVHMGTFTPALMHAESFETHPQVTQAQEEVPSGVVCFNETQGNLEESANTATGTHHIATYELRDPNQLCHSDNLLRPVTDTGVANQLQQHDEIYQNHHYQPIYYDQCQFATSSTNQTQPSSSDRNLGEQAVHDIYPSQASAPQIHPAVIVSNVGQQSMGTISHAPQYSFHHYPLNEHQLHDSGRVCHNLTGQVGHLGNPMIQINESQVLHPPLITYENHLNHQESDVSQETDRLRSTYHTLELHSESKQLELINNEAFICQSQSAEYQEISHTATNFNHQFSEYHLHNLHQEPSQHSSEEVARMNKSQDENESTLHTQSSYLTSLNLEGSTGVSINHSEDSRSSAASTSSTSSIMSEDSYTSSSLTRDEKRAREANIPLSYCDIVNLSIEQFNEQLGKYSLTESQLTLIKDIRRRGKNKVAAQSCRKRKMEQIFGLQHEVNHLANKRRTLNSDLDKLIKDHDSLNERYEHYCSLIQNQMRLQQLPL